MPDNTEKITELDEAIESGIVSSSGDGHSVTQDLAHLERVRRELRASDPDSITGRKVRPLITRMRLPNW
jgi:hypothetical protein